MKNPLKNIDKRYQKSCIYSVITIVASVVILYALYKSIPGINTVIKLINAIMKPLILGLIISYLLLPMVKLFEKLLMKKIKKEKLARNLSVLIVVLLVLAIISGILTVIIWTATKQITNINLDSIKQMGESIRKSFGSLYDQVINLIKKQEFGVDKNFNAKVTEFTKKFTDAIPSFLSGAFGTASTILFGFIFAVYFMLDGSNIARYWKNVGKAVLPRKTIEILRVLAEEADRCFSGYIRGQALDGLLVGVISIIMLQIIGMPYALIIGLVVGFGNLIPYVGPILGYIMIILINLVNFNPKMMIIGLIMLLVLMTFDGNVVNPKLLANAIHVHPLLVVAALLAGGAIGGILGMLLAVPTGAFAKLQFEKFIKYRQGKKEEDELELKEQLIDDL